MKPIRRVESRSNRGPDPVLTLESGAHLKIESHKLFEPKFNEETGAFWSPAFVLDLEVVDDGTEEGEADGLVFSDRYELKIDEDVREEQFGFKDDKPFRDSKKADFTKAQQETLLDMDNWTIRTETKLDRLMICLYGKKWTEGKVNFDPDHLVGKEFIAKVKPKTGKKQGSFTEWESYVSLNRPKKKRKAERFRQPVGHRRPRPRGRGGHGRGVRQELMICPYCQCGDRCGREAFWVPDLRFTPGVLKVIPGGRDTGTKKPFGRKGRKAQKDGNS